MSNWSAWQWVGAGFLLLGLAFATVSLVRDARVVDRSLLPLRLREGVRRLGRRVKNRGRRPHSEARIAGVGLKVLMRPAPPESHVTYADLRALEQRIAELSGHVRSRDRRDPRERVGVLQYQALGLIATTIGTLLSFIG